MGFVKEYPLVELYKAPLDPATTTIPSPNLGDDSLLRRYWRRSPRHWDSTTTPSTYEDLVEPNYYDAEQEVKDRRIIIIMVMRLTT